MSIHDPVPGNRADPALADAERATGEMSLGEALAVILGPERADAISLSMGRHWAVVAATAAATTDMDPRAIAALRKHLDEQRAKDAAR